MNHIAFSQVWIVNTMRPPADDSDDVYLREKAPQPLRTAVEQLGQDAHRAPEELEGATLASIFALAQQTYGHSLPEFWRIWKDWHDGDQIQPMGEL
jgi:hypothetical protein